MHVWVLLSLLACVGTPTDTDSSEDTGSSPVGDSTPDSAGTSGSDSTSDSDSASSTDSTPPDDTGPDDTGPDDTGPDDTGPDDTGVPAAEDCTNGVDDDGDGLLDCEDEACESDGACAESDCTDGADSDGDGLVDCEDDDCWSAACEGAAWARVTGGRLKATMTSYNKRANSWGGTDACGFGYWERGGSVVGWTASATGTVRFVHSGALETCTWTVDRAWGIQHYKSRSRLNGKVAYVSTSGGGFTTSCRTTVDTSTESSPFNSYRALALEPGCALSRTDFLPAPRDLVISVDRRVTRDAQVNTADGGTWYDGPKTFTYKTAAGSGGSSAMSSYALFAPLSPSDTYPTLP